MCSMIRWEELQLTCMSIHLSAAWPQLQRWMKKYHVSIGKHLLTMSRQSLLLENNEILKIFMMFSVVLEKKNEGEGGKGEGEREREEGER